MKKYPQDYTLVIPNNTLRFSSKFESGNLQKAIKINDNEYRLLLEHDTETLGYTQWYFFSVKPYKNRHKIRFNITNLMKYESLYNEGMKPLVFSHKEYLQKNINWKRNCSEVSYFPNSFPRQNGNKNYFTLTFSYTFESSEDIIYFAYSYPYTYTDLFDYINNLQVMHSSIFSYNRLCNTLAGNICPVITITNNLITYNTWPEELIKLNKSTAGRKLLRLRQSKSSEAHKEKHQKKKGIFITARVHPGESNSSYMVKGLIDFLIGNTREANSLRKKFIFKIVPMLNPDGVIYGNYRCSLLGVDLNRRWTHPNKLLHPTIYYTKKLLQSFTEENEVLMYCDMHGHSIKKDVFMYGCCNYSKDCDDMKKNIFIRLIPYLFSQKTNIFSYKNSKFRIEKNKISTGRVVNFYELGILASYTLEASFYGISGLENFGNHLTIIQLESLGKDLVSLFTTLINPKEFRKKLKELTYKLSGRATEIKQITEENNNNNEVISLKELITEINENAIENIVFEDDDSGGSDMEGSDNDEKKIEFKKKIEEKNELIKKIKRNEKEEKKERSGSPLGIIQELNNPLQCKSIRLFKVNAPLRRSKIKENRSSSLVKDRKIIKTIDDKFIDFTELFKEKSILHHSPIIFTRERIPNDNSLLNFSKKGFSKKNSNRNNLMEKRTRLQIVNTIKNKLDELF